jgi:hypothetical protein
MTFPPRCALRNTSLIVALASSSAAIAAAGSDADLPLWEIGVAGIGAFQINERTTLNLGLDAAFSAKSKDNEQRRGLPDLDYLVEIGPSLEYLFWDEGERKLTAIGQVRAAFAVDTNRLDYTGVAVEPQIVY